MSKSQAFRTLLNSPDLQIVMGAHDALSARLIERAGFCAIWASGLGISASAGLRDCSELSMTQLLAALEYMSDATSIPILVDADSGYGNFNDVRRLTRKLERLGVAAMCIEDSPFPRRNSFAVGSHLLISTDEFCGKIRAAKDSQSDSSFCAVARTETLVAGGGVNECLDRAGAYAAAGADAVLVQSIKSDPDQILGLCRQWNRRTPLILVPTAYPGTPIGTFAEAGASMIIWANHALRASVSAIAQVCRMVADSGTVNGVATPMTSIGQLFELLDYDELHDAERRYLIASVDGQGS